MQTWFVMLSHQSELARLVIILIVPSLLYELGDSFPLIEPILLSDKLALQNK